MTFHFRFWMTSIQWPFLNSRLRWIVLSGLFCWAGGIQSQDFKKQYQHAKDIFEAGKYSDALDAFRPLMVYDRNNPYTEYASFYSALSAQRLGFNKLAKETFLQTKKIYPKWDQLDEVNYWLVKIYLDQHEYFRALNIAREIKNEEIGKQIENLKRLAFSAIDDVETAQMLCEENPRDVEALRSLAQALGKNYSPDNERKLDSLTKITGWDKKDFMTSAEVPVFKEKYNVALLLPFRASSLDPTPGIKRSQFVLDLYQGMKLAADSLRSEGVMLNLLTYDTEHDQEVIKKLVKEPELRGADIMVGPLFPEDFKWVDDLAAANGINLVANPVSSNIDLLGKNPMSFLVQPSHATIGKKSAEMLATRVSKKSCFVFYGDSPKDSILAWSFMRQANKLGMKIRYAEEVRAENSADILATLATPTEFDEWKNPKQFKLKLDSLGSIFVASDDPLIYTKVLNSVETRGDSIVVVGQESWLEDGSVNFTKLEKIKSIFSAPNFTSITAQPYVQFRKKYFRKHGILPSPYAEKGFEFTMMIGHAFKKYGVHFQEGLKKEKLKGVLSYGYQMQDTRDNGVVPFVVFRKGRLVLVNEP
ncbi:MAG: hypothetical protein JST69_13450 [Bacteroidetes bacterium]|nr:hypothetical protein [Bacteroidota bacterium]